jgi:putative transposase
MKAWLLQQGYLVSRKRVRRLMRLMGLEAIYRRPNTSKAAPGHRVYPYLLKGVEVNRVDQVWSADITYIPMAQGFLYLVAIIDWHSRQVVAWKLSNTMDADFCVAALEEALGRGRPEIFNTDQGAQFTSEAFTQTLRERGIQVSMDGKGRYLDNRAPRNRGAGSGSKPPEAALVKSQGSERSGKGEKNSSGEGQGDERKRTTDDVSKR